MPSRVLAVRRFLRGDGIQTTRRLYWRNKATDIVADVPSEAPLTPNL